MEVTLRDIMIENGTGYTRKAPKNKPISQMNRGEILDYLHDTKEGQEMKEHIKKIMMDKTTKNEEN